MIWNYLGKWSKLRLEAVSQSQPGSQVIVNQVNTLSKQVPIISNVSDITYSIPNSLRDK